MPQSLPHETPPLHWSMLACCLMTIVRESHTPSTVATATCKLVSENLQAECNEQTPNKRIHTILRHHRIRVWRGVCCQV